MKKLISIIITSANESNSIKKTIKNLLDPKFNGLENINYIQIELITVIPDKETNHEAKNEIKKYQKYLSNWIKIIDPWKGKPTALNLAFKKARGSYIVLTDGDVYFAKNSLFNLLNKIIKGDKYAGATGRPVSQDKRNSFWGYTGHLLAEAANHKRENIMIKKKKFFIMSGYIMAIKNFHMEIPADCLSDDAYISYIIQKQGGSIVYEPTACVYVKYPRNIKDWLNQKARSVGGYMQLWTYGIVTQKTKVRNFWKELAYFYFPVKYAKNPKELLWSLCLYPLRGYLWLRIFWEQKVLRKEFYKTWVRIESTK